MWLHCFLDAIGRAIVSLDREVNNHLLFVITTDGLENSSVKFSKDHVKEPIQSYEWLMQCLIQLIDMSALIQEMKILMVGEKMVWINSSNIFFNFGHL